MVYIVKMVKQPYWKIGYTKEPNAQNRIRSLQTGNPFPIVEIAIMPGDEVYEALLHSRFARDRMQGEWFQESSELLDFIATRLEDRNYIPDAVDVKPVPLQLDGLDNKGIPSVVNAYKMPQR